jgi:predicted phage terminase large subunit-like protein
MNLSAFTLPSSRSVNLASTLWESQTLGMEREENNALHGLSLMQFIPQISPRFRAPEHLAPAIHYLERCLYEPHFLIIELPPRHYKTETILHFLAWYLMKRPENTLGYVSYAQRQAGSKVVKAHRYSLACGVSPNPKMQNREEWRTAQDGGILSTGIGGALTGQGVHGLVIDDPIKNREEAESPTFRAKHWDWFLDVAETRLEPSAFMVVLMTRWHPDDLAGRLIKERKQEWTVIRIPALADGLDAYGKKPARDLLGRKEGDALLPERYNKQYLERVKQRNPRGFASLYQGLPRPKDDYVFGKPTFYTQLPTEGLQFSFGADLAYTSSSNADYSVLVLGARKDDVFYIIDVQRWRERIGKTIQILNEAQKPHRYTAIGVESNGPQSAVCDMLEEGGVYIERINPVGDKYIRALSFSEAWNTGRVQVPTDAPWLSEYLEELQRFTGVGDDTDDQVDASVYAFMLSESRFSFHT